MLSPNEFEPITFYAVDRTVVREWLLAVDSSQSIGGPWQKKNCPMYNFLKTRDNQVETVLQTMLTLFDVDIPVYLPQWAARWIHKMCYNCDLESLHISAGKALSLLEGIEG